MGMGRDSYFEDQWDFFRADLRAKDDKGWTDMELVGVDDDGLFSSIKVSVLFSLGGWGSIWGNSEGGLKNSGQSRAECTIFSCVRHRQLKCEMS